MSVRHPSKMFENTVYGSVTDSDAEVIAHGCNRRGVMGAGVAKVIRNKYPEIFEPYLKACRDNKPLGSIIPVCCRNGEYVVNILTQDNYGRSSGVRYASPNAIKSGLSKTFDWMRENGLSSICVPEIGASLGGLSVQEFHGILLSLDTQGLSVEVRHIDAKRKTEKLKSDFAQRYFTKPMT